MRTTFSPRLAVKSLLLMASFLMLSTGIQLWRIAHVQAVRHRLVASLVSKVVVRQSVSAAQMPRAGSRVESLLAGVRGIAGMLLNAGIITIPTEGLPMTEILARKISEEVTKEAQAREASGHAGDTIISLPVHYEGNCVVPKKIYQNRVFNVTLDLKQAALSSSAQTKQFHVQSGDTGAHITMVVKPQATHLEAELTGVGLQICDDSKKKVVLPGPVHCEWSCYFPITGPYTLSLVLTECLPSDTKTHPAVKFTGKVVSCDNLTSQQASSLGAVCGVGGLIVSILGIVLGIFL